MHLRSITRACQAFLFGVLITAGPLAAQQNAWDRPTLNFFGIPGMLDMPTGMPMNDADLSFTGTLLPNTVRSTLHFQITPRLSGVFRYVFLDNYFGSREYYDRSFDLRYQLTDEGRYRPAVAIGLQDFGGTGIYANEYIVATKTFGKIRATAGVGWGRLAGDNGIDNPLGLFADAFKSRPEQTGGINQTGRLDTSHWFRGDMGFFGGVQYAVSDRLILSAEYSSDTYDIERERIDFDGTSPLNFGFTYRFRNGIDITGGFLYGTTATLAMSYTFNPKRPNKFPGGIQPGGAQIAVRPQGSIADLGWSLEPDADIPLRETVAQALTEEGFTLDALAVDARSVQLRFRNATQYPSAQAIGRIARRLSAIMPASVEDFVLIPVTENGISASRITLKRSDLEELENAPDGAWQSFARADFDDAYPRAVDLQYPQGAFPRFDWKLGPYVDTLLFDPSNPLRFNAGVELSARYEPTPGLVFQGLIRGQLLDSPGDSEPSNSVIQKVRSDVALYAQNDVSLTNLTVARYFRPGPDLYGRVTAGYLEPMYGGLSGELLWKPVDSRLALGVELNYAQQRDFDQGFGFQDYGTVTGHASAYYDTGKGFHYQLDVGRYLAKDLGGTLTVTREFKNGIKLGAFATLTDVSFEDFGEGSFDKGFRVDIPVSTITGRPSNRRLARTVRPVLRDGGARLNVGGRLYEGVRDLHQPQIQSQWGRFWR